MHVRKLSSRRHILFVCYVYKIVIFHFRLSFYCQHCRNLQTPFEIGPSNASPCEQRRKESNGKKQTNIFLFVTGNGWFRGDSCLDEHLIKVGRLSTCPESSAAEQVLGGRHVAVAFPFFHNSFVSGDNGRNVCLYEKKAYIYIYFMFNYLLSFLLHWINVSF